MIIAFQRRDGERAESVDTDGEVDPYDQQFLDIIISLFGGLMSNPVSLGPLDQDHEDGSDCVLLLLVWFQH